MFPSTDKALDPFVSVSTIFKMALFSLRVNKTNMHESTPSMEDQRHARWQGTATAFSTHAAFANAHSR